MKNISVLKVLVYGATGSQASPTIDELIRRGHHPVAVTHSTEKAVLLKSKGIESVFADMANAARLYEITQEVNVVFLLVPFFLQNPMDGLKYAKNAIDAAAKSNIKLIVWNASGMIPERPTGNPAIDVRMDIAQYLQASKVPYIIFQPSVYAENLLGPWTQPFIKKYNQLSYPVPDDVGIGWIPAQDVASLMVTALENPSLAGEAFLISGLKNLTGTELAQEFSIALNRTISYKAMAPKDFGGILDKAFGEGAGDKAAQEYQKMWNTKQFPPTHFPMANVIEKLPVKMTSIADWVRQHKTFFAGE
jgi:uncharacterized protein YbjT (DUF2867 family)